MSYHGSPAQGGGYGGFPPHIAGTGGYYGSPGGGYQGGGYMGGYPGGESSGYGQPSPGGMGKKRYREEDDSSNSGRGPQRRYNNYEGGGGRARGRGRGRGGYQGGRGQDDAAALAQAEQNFCNRVWKLGDSDRFDFRNEIPGIVRAVEDQWNREPGFVLKAFRVAAAELPHKLPHYALILAMLATSVPKQSEKRQPQVVHTATGVVTLPTSTETPDEVPTISTVTSLGMEIIKDLIKSFQAHLDSRRWRSTRLHLHLFAHLATLPRPLISKSSLVELLVSFTKVWDELGLVLARGDECFKVVAEVLIRSDGLCKQEAANIQALMEAMDSYMRSRKVDRLLFGDHPASAHYNDPIEDLYAVLKSGPSSLSILPTLHEPFALELEARARDGTYLEPLDLPTILVPPDEDEESTGPGLPAADGVATTNGQPRTGRSQGRKGPVDPDLKDRIGYSGVQLFLRLCTDESVPPRDTADGLTLRFLQQDIIDIYEVNRKDCAKTLLDLPRWVARGTFRSRGGVGAPPKRQREDEDTPDMSISIDKVKEEEESKEPNWSLESSVVEAALIAMFALPTSTQKPVYYQSLISELCRTSPSTVAPALGKCIRTLYAGLGAGDEEGKLVLEAEGARRFAEWFAVHLSNFGFMWGWKDWQGDLSLPAGHPKKSFISRVLELEVRLSYFDRIKGTLPDAYLNCGIFAAEAPGPAYEYDDPENLHTLAASDVNTLMRRKEPVTRLSEYFKAMTTRIQGDPINLSSNEAESVVRDVCFQVVLNVGSRSLSHFLNVVERYLPLLKELTGSPGARVEILKTVQRFWGNNAQFASVVVDKLLAYRIVDPVDAIGWLFEGTWVGMERWEKLTAILSKVRHRVVEGKRRFENLKRSEETKRGIERAVEGGGEDAQMEGVSEGDVAPESSTEEVRAAEEALKSHVAEQKSVLLDVIKRFDAALAAAPTEDANDVWSHWWLLGWYRELCRSSGKELRDISDDVERLSFESAVGKDVVQKAMAWGQT